ncbi:MAG: MBL fold metallo-hydrolase [Deferribacterota bacterium]|nr:MBL fold metallo-hydrolase [Deferribacterota bacterium]
MAIKVLTVGPLLENCIIYSKNEKCIIFDPGDEAHKIISYIEENNLKPQFILNTHGHYDHIGAVKSLQDKYNIPFYLHRDDHYLLDASVVAAFLGITNIEMPKEVREIKEGEVFTLEDDEFRAIHTPGHSKGSMCFYNEKEGILISGDTLFYLSIGRTDLPGGDYNSLITSVKNKLFILPDSTKVYPGHERPTTIGFEKELNPFFH